MGCYCNIKQSVSSLEGLDDFHAFLGGQGDQNKTTSVDDLPFLKKQNITTSVGAHSRNLRNPGFASAMLSMLKKSTTSIHPLHFTT